MLSFVYIFLTVRVCFHLIFYLNNIHQNSAWIQVSRESTRGYSHITVCTLSANSEINDQYLYFHSPAVFHELDSKKTNNIKKKVTDHLIFRFARRQFVIRGAIHDAK